MSMLFFYVNKFFFSAFEAHKGRCLQIQKYFIAIYDYAGKADLSKGYWNPERKLGVTTHFLGIIKQQYF